MRLMLVLYNASIIYWPWDEDLTALKQYFFLVSS